MPYGKGKQRGNGVLHRRLRLTTTGAAGSAVATRTLDVPFSHGQAGILRAVKMDFHATAPATTDLLIKSDSSGGATIFTSANSGTDSAIAPLGMPGINQVNAAIAATDGTAGGMPFYKSLYIDIAQSDPLTDALILDLWIEAVDMLEVRLYPTGADASAVATRQVNLNRAGAVRAIQVDYGAGVPATTDLVIKADSTSGETLLTLTNTNTDIIAKPVGFPAGDEGRLATAATDATDGGLFFRSGLFFDVAQADNYGTNEDILVRCWID